MSIIRMEQVSKQVGELSIGPMNVDIPAGSTVAVIGDNGSGKSTLLKMILGLIKADSGSIQLFGKERQLGDHSWRERIAYQPQVMTGCGRLTGEEILALTAHFSPAFDHQRFNRSMQALQISLNRRLDSLSPGSQKKWMLALTMAQRKDLLLLDEPAASIDLLAQKFIIDELVDLMEEDAERTILFTSHQLHDIHKLADYLLFIRQGALLGLFEKDDLASKFVRYWLDRPLDCRLPGVIRTSQDRREVISYHAHAFEQELNLTDSRVIRKINIGLEEVIPGILSGELDLSGCHDQQDAVTV
ncbi:ATP-binding cassette domain-containing protein [Bacillus xiapuensis]|uniref:ATP-binding cassette domain-containing protein n=1 Tax=Bacillus xiapuensis TaxID=2014075 RepID=UPI000C24A701|nr:ABC transporter ATP-binding protein [Bacillus xiapuensis]